jgi:broad specificity phosphatase PhoE
MTATRVPDGVTLYLIRHGETDWNAEGRLQGGRDIPLNALGRQQAAAVAQKLRDLARDADRLSYLCSPLGRSRDTMQIMRTAMGLNPMDYTVDERLREITFGRWEGLTWREVRASDPAAARAREAGKWAFRPPEGESYEMLRQRVMPVFASIDRDSVIVSHGGVMRAALAGFGFESPHEASSLDIWQGRIVVVTRSGYDWR